MDVQALLNEFLGSQHAAGAQQSLADLGFNPDDTASILATATATAHAHAEEHAASSGLLGEHPGRNFFAAFAAGLVRGDGFIGALEDGGEGVLVGRVTEALTNQLGLDSSTASAVAAAATPYVVGFLKEKLRG